MKGGPHLGWLEEERTPPTHQGPGAVLEGEMKMKRGMQQVITYLLYLVDLSLFYYLSNILYLYSTYTGFLAQIL